MVEKQDLVSIGKDGQAVVKVTNDYYETFQKLLCAGAYQKLKERKDKGISDGLIDKFSPNNVRRVILGLDGIYVQFYVSTTPYGKVQQKVATKLSEQLVFELVNPQTKSTPVLKVLRGDGRSVFGSRVFSSIEEIVILNQHPEFEGTFNNSGLDWFLNPRNKVGVESSFKRLRSVGIVTEPVTLDEFLVENAEVLKDPLGLVLGNTTRQVQGTLFNDPLYFKHTSLRPQYYSMDEEGSALYNYFQKVKGLVPKTKGVYKPSGGSVDEVKEVTSLARLLHELFGVIAVHHPHLSSDHLEVLDKFLTLSPKEVEKSGIKRAIGSVVSKNPKVKEMSSHFGAPFVGDALTKQVYILSSFAVSGYEKTGVEDLEPVVKTYLKWVSRLMSAMSRVTGNLPEQGSMVERFCEGTLLSSEKGIEEALSWSDELTAHLSRLLTTPLGGGSDSSESVSSDKGVSENQADAGLLDAISRLSEVDKTTLEGLVSSNQGNNLSRLETNLEGLGMVPTITRIQHEGVWVSDLFAVYKELNGALSVDDALRMYQYAQVCGGEDALFYASVAVFAKGAVRETAVREVFSDVVNLPLVQGYLQLKRVVDNEPEKLRPSFAEFANELVLLWGEFVESQVLAYAYLEQSGWVSSVEPIDLPMVSYMQPQLARWFEGVAHAPNLRGLRFKKLWDELGIGNQSGLYATWSHIGVGATHNLTVPIEASSFMQDMVAVLTYEPPKVRRDVGKIFQEAVSLVEGSGGEFR